MPDAKIIPLFPKTLPGISCFECTNGYIGRDGVICELTRDLVFNESDASNCEAYEKDDAAS